jgi:hypothetical protein
MAKELSLTSVLLPSDDEPLARFILFVLGSIWFVAVVACFKAVTHYQNHPARTNRESIAELEDELSCTADRIASAAPAVLIMVGLLGTFVGIAGAIHAAAEALTNSGDVSERLGELSKVLGLIGLKFKSSAWGLIASLSLRPLVSLYPLRIRNHLAKEAAARNADRARLLQQQQIQTLLQISAESSNLSRLDALINQLGTAAIGMHNAVTQSGQAAASLSGSVTEFRSSTAKILSEATAAITTSVRSSGQQMDTAVGSLSTLTASIQKTLEANLREIKSSLAGAMTSSGNQLADASRRNTAAIQDSLGGIGKLVGTVGENASRQSSDLRLAIEAALKSIENVNAQQVESLGRRSEEATRVLAGALESMQEALDVQAERSRLETAKVGTATTDALTAFSTVQKAQSDRFAQGIDQLEGALSQMSAAVDELSKLTIRVNAVLENSEDVKGELKDAVVNLNERLNTIAGDFLKATTMFQKLVIRASSSSSVLVEPPLASD